MKQDKILLEKMLNYREEKQIFEDKIEQYNLLKSRLTAEEINDYNEQFRVEYTHHSTSIEGNTLTLIDTKMILQDKVVPAETSLKELQEILGHSEAWTYVKRNIENKVPISEEVIKDIHQEVLSIKGIGGMYRNIAVYIRGATHVPPSPDKVRNKMKFLMDDWNTIKFNNSFEKAAWLHLEFLKIHPFQDGNGRTARLLMNYSLMEDGLPPICIKTDQVKKYFEALENCCVNNTIEPLKKLIENSIEKDIDNFIKMYGYHLKHEISQIPKQKIISKY